MALVLEGLDESTRFFLKMMGPRMGRHAAMTDMQGSTEPHIMVLIVVTVYGQ